MFGIKQNTGMSIWTIRIASESLKKKLVFELDFQVESHQRLQKVEPTAIVRDAPHKQLCRDNNLVTMQQLEKDHECHYIKPES